MGDSLSTNERINRELTGDAISAADHEVTPFARLQGRWGTNGGKGHEFGYALLKLTPVKIRVRDAHGRTEEIELIDVNARATAAMGAIALAVAAVCLVIPIVRKLLQ
jgi:hypothetical protein